MNAARPTVLAAHDRRGLALVALGAALISSAPVLVKLAADSGVGPTATGAWRCLLGSVILFALLALRGAPLRPTPGTAAVAALAGLAFAADLFAWHRAVVLVGAGMATIFGNTQVFWTSAYGRVAYGESLPLSFLVAAVSAFCGVAMLAGVGSGVPFTTGHLQGVAFGLVTGLFYAAYIVALRQGAGRADGAPANLRPHGIAGPMNLLAWATLTCGVAMTLSTLIEGATMAPPNTTAVAVLIVLAAVPHVLGWLVIATGMTLTSASRGALVLLLQPTLAALWGFLLFNERLTPLQLLGAAVTLTSVYVGSRRR